MMKKRNIFVHGKKVLAIPDTDTLNDYLNNSEIDSSLAELVKIRASQLNECEHCTNLHIQQARLSGEKDRKIIGLNIWPDIPFYSDKERAALAWTEVLTRFSEKNVKKEFYEEVSSYLSNKELKVLSKAISSINHWKQKNPGESTHRSI